MKEFKQKPLLVRDSRENHVRKDALCIKAACQKRTKIYIYIINYVRIFVLGFGKSQVFTHLL